MGVKGLITLIERFAPSAIKISDIKTYSSHFDDKYVNLAIDASMQLYRFLAAMISEDKFEGLKREDGKVVSHILGVIKMTHMMIKNNMIPTWVFDGNSPEIKQKTIDQRVKAKHDASKKLDRAESSSEITSLMKQTIKISDEQIKDVKYLLEILGIPYIQSYGEADSQLVALTKAGITHGIITNDWDILPFGGSNMLKDFSSKKIININLEELLNKLMLTQEQFIELCNIIGNDYCNGIPGYGAVEAYRNYKKYDHDVNKLLNNTRGDFDKEKYLIDFYAAKQYYLSAPVINPRKLNLLWKEPNYKALTMYLRENNFSDNFTNNFVCSIKDLYEKYLIYLK